MDRFRGQFATQPLLLLPFYWSCRRRCVLTPHLTWSHNGQCYICPVEVCRTLHHGLLEMCRETVCFGLHEVCPTSSGEMSSSHFKRFLVSTRLMDFLQGLQSTAISRRSIHPSVRQSVHPNSITDLRGLRDLKPLNLMFSCQ